MPVKLDTRDAHAVDSSVRDVGNIIPEQSSFAADRQGLVANVWRTPEFLGAATRTRGRAAERRAYPRVRLALTVRVQRIAGQRYLQGRSLQTRDISSSGAYFLSPRAIPAGTPVELEFIIVDRPLGNGTVKMLTEAHVVRSSRDVRSGWHGVAAAFDDIRFVRDEPSSAKVRIG